MAAAAPPSPVRPPGVQSPSEEWANALSHLAGALLAVAGLVLLVVFASFSGDPWRIVSVAVYGASLVVLFAASTCYHGAPPGGRLKRALLYCDHAAIFLLIAGTYTPFALVTLRGSWGFSLFGVEWGLALAGLLYEARFLGRYPAVSVALYLAMGWVALVALGPLAAALPAGGMALVVLGGVLYTAGVAFYRWHSLPGHHVLWHFFVLGGAAAHWAAIWAYVLPPG